MQIKTCVFFIEGNLTPLDLFNPNFVPSLDSQPDMYEDPKAVSTPLLYVGIHNHQLYVQESSRIADLTISDQSKHEISENPSISTRLEILESFYGSITKLTSLCVTVP
jgi:hypothetical protein